MSHVDYYFENLTSEDMLAISMLKVWSATPQRYAHIRDNMIMKARMSAGRRGAKPVEIQRAISGLEVAP